MKSLFKLCLLLLAPAMLVSCGGGGSDGHAAFSPPVGNITLNAVTKDLPLNAMGYLPQPGGPFTSEVTITIRHADGTLATEVETVGVSINPASVATFSTLDDPETSDINEIVLRLGQAPVDVVGGKATVFVTSYTTKGTATLTVSTDAAGDGGGGFTSTSMEFTVGNVDPPPPAADPTIELDAQTTSLPLNSQGALPDPGGLYTTEVTITLHNPDGSLATQINSVNVSINPASVATFSTLDDAETADLNEVILRLGQAPVDVLSGKATVFVTSYKDAGTATLTVTSDAGSFDPATLDFTVGQVPEPNHAAITLQAQTTDLPLNKQTVLPNPGGPYTAEVTVTVRNADGTLASNVQSVNVSINPATVATFSILDKPETDDINELLLRLGQAPVDVVAGKATIFVTAYASPGTATLAVTTNATANDGTAFTSATTEITVGRVSALLPARVTASSEYEHVYLPESGGRSTSLLTATVTDAGDEIIPDSHNPNVQFEVLGGLTHGTVTGNSQKGATIQTNSTNGIARAMFTAGSEAGPVSIKVTADGADNDVSNGISDPISATVDLVVSDGKPFSVTLVSPMVNAVFINGVSSGVVPEEGPNGIEIPPELDGTYSLTVSAVVTDRQGNPVLPGTQVRFGAIDFPVTGFPTYGAGAFVHSGVHGDPQEGGTLFTAPNAQFTVVPDAGPQAKVGPGDTLLLYGKAVPGNSDLEGARQVAQVTGPTSLLVSQNRPFNLNDITGQSQDFGEVLPWVIGRANVAVIDASAATDEHGTASVRLTYPIHHLGQRVAVFAQAVGGTDDDPLKLVSDVADIRFPGVAPGRIVASPTPIRGNAEVVETVCVFDALGAPIGGIPIAFGFANLGDAGQGSVDGHPASGLLDTFTGAYGCTTGLVKTESITTSGTLDQNGNLLGPGVIFSAGGTSVAVPIIGPEDLILLASPSSLGGGGGTVTLTLIDGAGNPVSGVQITGTCEADDEARILLENGPGVTDENGQTTAEVDARGMNGYGDFHTGECIFATAGHEPTVTVPVKGIDLCTLYIPGTSPGAPPQCNFPTTQSSLFAAIVRGVATGGGMAVPTAQVQLTSSPAGLSCMLSPGVPGMTCTPAQFASGTNVLLNATVVAGGPVSFSWSGDCAGPAGASTAAVLIGSSGTGYTCQLTVDEP